MYRSTPSVYSGNITTSNILEFHDFISEDSVIFRHVSREQDMIQQVFKFDYLYQIQIDVWIKKWLAAWNTSDRHIYQVGYFAEAHLVPSQRILVLLYHLLSQVLDTKRIFVSLYLTSCWNIHRESCTYYNEVDISNWRSNQIYFWFLRGAENPGVKTNQPRRILWARHPLVRRGGVTVNSRHQRRLKN